MALPRSPRIPSAFLLPPRWSPAASSRGPAVSSGDAEQLYHCSKPNTIRKVSLQQQLNRITHSEPKETSLGDVSGSRLLRSTDVTVTLSSSCPLAAPSPAACTRAEPAPGVRALHEAHHAGWVHVADGLSQRGRCPPLGTCHVPALPGGTGHGVPEDARSGGRAGPSAAALRPHVGTTERKGYPEAWTCAVCTCVCGRATGSVWRRRRVGESRAPGGTETQSPASDPGGAAGPSVKVKFCSSLCCAP